MTADSHSVGESERNGSQLAGRQDDADRSRRDSHSTAPAKLNATSDSRTMAGFRHAGTLITTATSTSTTDTTTTSRPSLSVTFPTWKNGDRKTKRIRTGDNDRPLLATSGEWSLIPASEQRGGPDDGDGNTLAGAEKIEPRREAGVVPALRQRDEAGGYHLQARPKVGDERGQDEHERPDVGRLGLPVDVDEFRGYSRSLTEPAALA